MKLILDSKDIEELIKKSYNGINTVTIPKDIEVSLDVNMSEFSEKTVNKVTTNQTIPPTRKELSLEEKLKADFPEEAYSADNSRGFELTSIKAAYVIERLNEVFGLCGTGWKYEVSKFDNALDDTTGSVAEVGVKVKLWYKMENGEWSEPITHVGGKRVVKGNYTDARKSAITDGLTKIASMLGVGHKAFKGLIRAKEGNEQPRQM